MAMTARRRPVADLLWRGRPQDLRERALGAALFGGAVAAVFIGGALITRGAFYDALVKPPYAPPGFVFPLVWGAIWTCVAAAGYLAWASGGLRRAGTALALWALHLVLNLGWSAVFFGAGALSLAAGWIAALLGVAVMAAIGLWSVRPLAGALMTPLVCWLFFAATVAADIARLNL